MRRKLLLAGLASGAAIAAARFFPYPSYEKEKGVTSATPVTRESAKNPIVAENALEGTTGWMIAPGQSATTQIQAYVGARSVAPGQTLTFYVSTQKPNTKYTIAIYRLGWYQGSGGRLVHSVSNLVGQAQGYYDAQQGKLINCPTAFFDPETRLVEARWKPSYKLTIPKDWVTGLYLVKCIDENGFQTYTCFDVLGNENADYVVVTADTTYAAYNNWGGYSLYDDSSIEGPMTVAGDPRGKRAAKVSFDRPSAVNDGSDQVLIYQLNALRWLERQGYNLSYISSIDLHTRPDLLLRHKAFISIGHDEYWTLEMRTGVERARDHGIGLAFMQANAAYWHCRLEPNTAGVPNRTVVCYKVLSDTGDLARDPLYGQDNSRVTSLWRDPVLNRPENSLIGIMFSDYNRLATGAAWKVIADGDPLLMPETGLKRGQSYDHGLVGYEWDKVFDNGHTPKNLRILATSNVVSVEGKQDISNTTYYIAPSGALVFATGSIYWARALDSYRYQPQLVGTRNGEEVREIQQLMTNVMQNLIKRHR